MRYVIILIKLLCVCKIMLFKHYSSYLPVWQNRIRCV